MRKMFTHEVNMKQTAAKALIEMMLDWDEPATFQQMREEDGTVTLRLSKRTYARAMGELGALKKAGRI